MKSANLCVLTKESMRKRGARLVLRDAILGMVVCMIMVQDFMIRVLVCGLV